jgi:hypothetical protein
MQLMDLEEVLGGAARMLTWLDKWRIAPKGQ